MRYHFVNKHRIARNKKQRKEKDHYKASPSKSEDVRCHHSVNKETTNKDSAKKLLGLKKNTVLSSPSSQQTTMEFDNLTRIMRG